MGDTGGLLTFDPRDNPLCLPETQGSSVGMPHAFCEDRRAPGCGASGGNPRLPRYWALFSGGGGAQTMGQKQVCKQT